MPFNIYAAGVSASVSKPRAGEEGTPMPWMWSWNLCKLELGLVEHLAGQRDEVDNDERGARRNGPTKKLRFVLFTCMFCVGGFHSRVRLTGPDTWQRYRRAGKGAGVAAVVGVVEDV
ncbi:hypothetical protein TraAM80_05224 [Trypanosoma rangeli]|uniref:Uncharacterized protein n=1 Tax=Trypanosoma rangeli TaxID=5698 RepID=A0A422NFW5_TRYRA|nr:uncharacterized protein TraAM80_05224 [Trypanosoma rangeli]RNF04329.1 hypothetical protein TraAM80_05224 [Trypanosoma rangeli]|eukprot:RNF04329.1 hypothetical protein TraAM80_05224 [Trypanosoma rangeli]